PRSRPPKRRWAGLPAVPAARVPIQKPSAAWFAPLVGHAMMLIIGCDLSVSGQTPTITSVGIGLHATRKLQGGCWDQPPELPARNPLVNRAAGENNGGQPRRLTG